MSDSGHLFGNARRAAEKESEAETAKTKSITVIPSDDSSYVVTHVAFPNADSKASELANWLDSPSGGYAKNKCLEAATELRRLKKEIEEWNVAFGVWSGTLWFREERIEELEAENHTLKLMLDAKPLCEEPTDDKD